MRVRKASRSQGREAGEVRSGVGGAQAGRQSWAVDWPRGQAQVGRPGIKAEARVTQEYCLRPPQRPLGFLDPASSPVFEALAVQIPTVPPLDWSVAVLSISTFQVHVTAGPAWKCPYLQARAY